MRIKAIPVAERERIIHLYAKGHRTKEIASVLDYCVAAVRRVRQNMKRRGTLNRKRIRVVAKPC
jgi:DNA-binding NarL/FixJ family response regulator